MAGLIGTVGGDRVLPAAVEGVKASESAANNAGALETALARAVTDGYSSVILPEDTLAIDPFVIPNATPTQPINLRGHGRGKSVLQFPTDGAADSYAIKAEDAASGWHGTISDLSMEGPGAYTLGGTPSAMHGIEVCDRMNLRNVQVSKFHGGLVITNDHNNVELCSAGNNKFGLYHANHVGGGDQQYIGCDFTGNTVSSVGIRLGDTVMAGARFFGCHFGVAPYCFYFEDDGAADDTLAMGGVEFYGCSFEAFGSALIHDPSFKAKIQDIVFYGAGNWSMYEAFKMPAVARDAFIKCRTINRLAFKGQGPVLAFNEGTITLPGGLFKTKALTGLHVDQARAVITAAEGYSVPMGTGLENYPGAVFLDDSYDFEGMGGSRFNSGVTKGELARIKVDAEVSPMTASGMLEGVSMNTTASGVGDAGKGDLAVVCRRGKNIPVRVAAGGGVSTNDVLVPDASTPTQVETHLAAGVQPVVGIAEGTVAAGALASVTVRVQANYGITS